MAAPRWLAHGGAAAEGTPEFYWELEVRRIAKELQKERDWKPMPLTLTPESQRNLRTSLAETDDYRAAVGSKTGDAKWESAHQTRRTFLNARQWDQVVFHPDEDHEFADYHLGALAYLQGKDRYDQARAAWESLLARPPEQRRFRSTWAAMMLGWLELGQGDYQASARRFHQVRALTEAGCEDSLHLAADSIGWEAHACLKMDKHEAAAELYLQQLSLGGDSAVVSLRQTLHSVDDAARSPLLRRLMTAQLLSAYSPFWRSSDSLKSASEEWLSAIESAGIVDVADAEHLGWLAYSCGQYDQAQSWLDRSTGKSSAAHWLRAKLLRRQGRLKEAAEELALAVKELREIPALSQTSTNPDQLMPYNAAGADLGGLQLERGEFIEALSAFRTAGMDQDAAYMAERVLTPEELRDYVDKTFIWTPERDAETMNRQCEHGLDDAAANEAFKWRWMLGRRLVRGKQFDAAREYLPGFVRPILDRYSGALKSARARDRSKMDRAKSWFQAAILARHDGFQMMATEVEPDAMTWRGSFTISHIAGERLKGEWFDWPSWSNEAASSRPLPMTLRVTTEENARLRASHLRNEKRFHYRYLAAEHCAEAAKLLPSQSEELADVLNTAGRWLKDRDPTAADPFLQQLERRAWNTKIGTAVLAKHWFVEMDGPWSTEAYAYRGGRF